MAFCKEEEGSQVRIQGILGVDILQYLKQARIIKCMNDSARLTSSKIPSFGDMKNFLYEDQVSSTENKLGRGTNNYPTIISKNIACPEQMLEDLSNPKPIRKGDIVIIKNPTKPRPFWKLGRVIELFRDSDNNKVHSARIKRGDGITDNHSLKHLHSLELSLTQDIFLITQLKKKREKFHLP